MKRISIYALGLVLSSLFFVACEKEGKTELTFDKNSVEMIVGEEDVVKVSGGEAPYTAVPADEEVIEVTVKGSDITIKTLKVGNTTVKVADKNGVEAVIAVKVEKDPYEEEKADATVRVKWDQFEKVLGEDAGSYTLVKAENKTVVFSWTDEEENESFVLTLKDPQGLIGAEPETASAFLKDAGPADPMGELVIGKGEEENKYDVAKWELIQAQPAEEGTPDSYWVTFTANGKEGLFVVPLTEVE